MEPIEFIKMHGLGNDFVIIDLRVQKLTLTPEVIQIIADRHRGVGCDQLVTIETSSRADCLVKFYNADGSESGACGNASRCVGALMMEETGQDTATLETTTALLHCRRNNDQIAINMGQPRTNWQDIPLAKETDTLHLGISLGELSDPVAVSMGNPHMVFFVENAEAIDLATLGPQLEHHPLFPERTNVEAAQVLSSNAIRLRVWERGSGETPACGTGACATVVAAQRRGLVGNHVTVHLPGGDLHIEREKSGEVIMTGPVAKTFSGTLHPELFA